MNLFLVFWEEYQWEHVSQNTWTKAIISCMPAAAARYSICSYLSVWGGLSRSKQDPGEWSSSHRWMERRLQYPFQSYCSCGLPFDTFGNADCNLRIQTLQFHHCSLRSKYDWWVSDLGFTGGPRHNQFIWTSKTNQWQEATAQQGMGNLDTAGPPA